MTTALAAPIGRHTRPGTADLALVGEIAALADSPSLLDAVDAVVRRLRAHVNADAAELFLAARGRQEMFLVSHQGLDLEAFCQRDRFRTGEGFPGLALRSAVPVVTRHLETDPNFLRSRVKALHYRSAVCVPFPSGDGVGGCLLFAWRSPHAHVRHVTWLATLVARPLGTALELARTRNRLWALQHLVCHGSEPRTGGGRVEPPPSLESRAVVLAPARLPDVVPRASRERCPARRGLLQVLGGRAGWPEHCLRAGCAAKARYCIPLVADGALWAVASVAFQDRAPQPLTRYLPMALWQTEDLAPPPPERSVRGASACQERLEIRCFGGFEARLDGCRLAHADFGRAKARELLALLVVAEGRPASGERLAEALWPGADPGPARNRFHVTLSALRRAIEPAGRRGWTHVCRDGRGYYLDRHSSVLVDLWRFDELLRHASAFASGEAHRMAALEEAVALCRADAFDEQFTGAWQDGIVRRYRDTLTRAREQLARLQAGGRDRAPPASAVGGAAG